MYSCWKVMTAAHWVTWIRAAFAWVCADCCTFSKFCWLTWRGSPWFIKCHRHIGPHIDVSLSLSARRSCASSQASGVTRVGVTRGGNWGCHPSIFPEKLAAFILVITVFSHHRLCQFCGVTPVFIDFTRVSPPAGCHPAPFYLSDLVSPLFFVNCPQKTFSFRVSPPLRMSTGAVRPSPSPKWRHCPKPDQFPLNLDLRCRSSFFLVLSAFAL